MALFNFALQDNTTIASILIQSKVKEYSVDPIRAIRRSVTGAEAPEAFGITCKSKGFKFMSLIESRFKYRLIWDALEAFVGIKQKDSETK